MVCPLSSLSFKCPMKSVSWLILWSMYRSGRFRPPYFGPEKKLDLRVCQLRCCFGRSATRAGACMCWHWLGVKEQHDKGYTNFGLRYRLYEKYASMGVRADFQTLSK
jgi:hypothetical protein